MSFDSAKLEGKAGLLSPFALEPMFVPRVWGSTDLRPWYDFQASQEPIGEVWLTGDACKVKGGDLAGQTLSEVFAQNPEAMLGSGLEYDRASPLLLKVIFAKEKLSVQVHPDDRLAQKYGQPRGKTECWYALAAEPGAEVAAGLLPGVTLAEIEGGVADQTLEKSLDILPVEAGDMIYVDAGTVHAIWPGSVLLETQQNCDLTYRLYDYGRPRELHIAKALEATRLATDAGKIEPIALADRTILVERGYFAVEKIPVSGVRSGASMADVKATQAAPEGKTATSEGGLVYLFAADGVGRITPVAGGAFVPVELSMRGIVAIPASSPEWQIEDLGGLQLIRITPRWPRAMAA